MRVVGCYSQGNFRTDTRGRVHVMGCYMRVHFLEAPTRATTKEKASVRQGVQHTGSSQVH